MKFYAYKGKLPLGKEPLGTFDKLIFELRTKKGAIRHCEKYLGLKFMLYTYYNFFDDKTFTLINKG
jgi:hypothetical protein